MTNVASGVDELAEPLRDAYEVLTAGTAQVIPEGGLAALLATADQEGRPLRVKLGLDPSGADLTLGHAVVLRKLRQFQSLGHVAVLVVGDFTAQVGDPSGRTDTRQMLTSDQTTRNSAGYVDQVTRILDPERTEVRRNSEWLAGMTMADVMRHTKELTVARLLERDDFARRFRDGMPISLVEFMYPLLQAIDSVAVHSDVEIGGTDQTYNNLVGRVLQRASGQPPQVVLTVPLLEGLDGVEKMGKSLDNYVAIAEPPGSQFGKLMSIPDSIVARYAQLCTDLHPGEVARIQVAAESGGRAAGEAKREVAREIVGLYHGTAAAAEAEESFDRVFRGGGVPDDVPEHVLGPQDPVHLPTLLVDLGFAGSGSAGRRLVDQGAVRVGGDRVGAGQYDIRRAELVDSVLVAGKRRQCVLRA